jgi:16S rRNA (cytidine1402-2'-O)-methyltransferase
MNGTLYLIPTTLGDTSIEASLPSHNLEIILGLKVFIVEELRTARRFLRKVSKSFPIDQTQFFILNEHSLAEELPEMMNSLREGIDVGLLSEAGLPCVADPGAQLVKLAQAANIKVIPLPGPSSIFLALMASGFNGQNFAFLGYLPLDKHEKIKSLKEMEKNIFQNGQTQIFIETPYRNNQLLEFLLQNCSQETMICIAADITLESEYIRTGPVSGWKKEKPDLNKRPAVFLLYR